MTARTAISLFSGAGGMDIGFGHAGFSILWANDLNETACETYRRNHHNLVESGPIEEFLPMLRQYRGVDLVFGGPPCQGFSVAGKMDPDDKRSLLLWSFFDAVQIVRPSAFVCENVKALAVSYRWRSIRQQMFARAASLGYYFCLVLLNSSQFGVPQSRERMFLIGSRDIPELRKCLTLFSGYASKPRTTREILTELGPAGSLNNKRICKAKITIAAKPVLRRSPYAGMLFNGQGRPINPDGYSATLHASMGGNKTPIVDEDHLYRHEPSWIEEYHSRLMNGEDPLPCDGAPARLRRLTVDEAVLLQTFPRNYDFAGSQSQIFTQIGNAVPCKLAYAVARVVHDLLSDEYSSLVSDAVRSQTVSQLELGLRA